VRFAQFALLGGTALMTTAPMTTAASAAAFKCPRIGGDFTFAQSANVNSLDQMTSSAVSTRNIAMNVFETLITRSDTNQPIPELAESVTESPDHLSFTFKLRQAIRFHNGETMSSADVVASFERYKRVGLQRNTFDNVARWDAPDASTFVITLKEVQPTFLEQLSSFAVPIVIVPAELQNDPPQQLRTIGTGPWQMIEFVPGSFVKLKRFADYSPNTDYEDRTGFGGYKQACFDSVTFRIVTEPGARVAGMQTGELQGAEDIPTKAVATLKADRNITLLPIQNWSILIAYANLSQPPTDNLYFRKALQAALNMDEIMDAATDGNYRLNVGFQYPHQSTYTNAGEETYNLHNTTLAKTYLDKAGYKGEPVVLLTNKDYTYMYNASVVMAEEMKAVGINAQLKIVDWPTAVAMRQKPDSGWNYFYTGWGTEPSLGPIPTMQVLVPPNPVYAPPPGKADPDLATAFRDMSMSPTPEQRQAAFARMQQRTLDQAYVVPFGSLTVVQAVRSNVKGYKTFRIPRVSNVWFE
jgi:peptide/nickel transport system substrate-binding protein